MRFLFVLGSGFGTVISPPIVNYIITKYSWQGVVLFYASLCLLAAILGLFLVSAPFKQNSSSSSGGRNSSSCSKVRGQELVTLTAVTEKTLENEAMKDKRLVEGASYKSISDVNVFAKCQNRNLIISSSDRNAVLQMNEETSLNDKRIKHSPSSIRIPKPVTKSTFSTSPSEIEESTRLCEKLCWHVGKALNATYVIHPLLILFCCVNLLGGLRYEPSKVM